MSLIMSQVKRQKRYGVFVLAIVMLLTGGGFALYYLNDFMIRSIGVLMCMVGAYLIKISNFYVVDGSQNTNKKAPFSKRLGPIALGLGAVSAVMLGSSLFFLHADAVNGYEGVWPVYAFAGSSVICAVVWGYIFAKMTQS